MMMHMVSQSGDTSPTLILTKYWMSLGPRPYIITMSLCPRWSSLPQEHSYSDLSMVSWIFWDCFTNFLCPHRNNCINVLPWQLQRHCLFWYVWCLDWQPFKGQGGIRGNASSAQINMNVYCMYYVHCTHNSVCVCERECVCVYEGLTLH